MTTPQHSDTFGYITRMGHVNPKAIIAEFFATALFVFVCPGVAALSSQTLATSPAFGIVVPFSFGLGITTLIYLLQNVKGAGHINPAVTLGILLSNFETLAHNSIQSVLTIVAQCAGALFGSSLLLAVTWDTYLLGANSVNPGFHTMQAFVGEAIMTALLVTVVLTLSYYKNPNLPFIVGFAVFLAHAVLVPVDGCSINPARSFGPAVIVGFAGRGDVVFFTAPFLGSVLGVFLHKVLVLLGSNEVAQSNVV
jgi:glycerol uptake facilitator-like aquaporin